MKNNFIFLILTWVSISAQAQNKEDLWILKPNYLFIETDAFSNNIARVRLHDGWHYLKKGDSLPSKDVYKEAYNYYNGFACVLKKTKSFNLEIQQVVFCLHNTMIRVLFAKDLRRCSKKTNGVS